MINNYVTNLQPSLVGFDAVTTSTTAGTYTQLPSHPNVDAVIFTRTPTTNGVPVNVAFSATPAAGQFLNVATTSIGYVTVPTGPTRNSNALFATNESGANALVISFMYVGYDNNKAFPVNRGTAG